MNCLRPGRGKEPDSTGEGDGGRGATSTGCGALHLSKRLIRTRGSVSPPSPGSSHPPVPPRRIPCLQSSTLTSTANTVRLAVQLASCFTVSHRRRLCFFVFSHFSPGATRDKGLLQGRHSHLRLIIQHLSWESECLSSPFSSTTLSSN